MNTEDLLTDVLRAKADDADRSGTPLATVTGHAHTIRTARRRRMVSVVGAAATVAAVAAVTTVVLGGGETADSPTGPVPTSPSSTHDATVASLDQLPLGRKPGIDYLVGDTYVTMSGERLTSATFGKAGTATPARGGILTAEATPPMGAFTFSRIALVTADTSKPLGCGVASFAMSTDGVQSAYWLSDSCSPGGGGKLYTGVNNTMGDSGPSYVATPPRAIDAPVGIISQGVVVNDVGGDTNGPTPLLIAGDGTTKPLPRLAVAHGSDENNGVISGQLADAASTGAVIDASTGAVKWQAPGWQLGQFSEDGKYLLAQRLDDPSSFAILDATTGTQTARLERLGGDISLDHLAWDFDDTLLAAATEGNAQAILRFDGRGHATRATPIRPATSGYRLAARP